MGSEKQNLEQALRGVVRERAIGNQSALITELSKLGIEVAQPSLSRILMKLNITKVGGFYKLPQISQGDSNFIDFLDIFPSGESILVARTSPGSASRAAFKIDQGSITGVVGTIAGDDTIFIALENSSCRASATSAIVSLFM